MKLKYRIPKSVKIGLIFLVLGLLVMYSQLNRVQVVCTRNCSDTPIIIVMLSLLLVMTGSILLLYSLIKFLISLVKR